MILKYSNMILVVQCYEKTKLTFFPLRLQVLYFVRESEVVLISTKVLLLNRQLIWKNVFMTIWYTSSCRKEKYIFFIIWFYVTYLGDIFVNSIFVSNLSKYICEVEETSLFTTIFKRIHISCTIFHEIR